MSQFVDECQLCARGGDGGAGAVSFRREAHVPRGGPDGGDGGHGGDVWLVADRNAASLLAFRDHPHRAAKSGTHGQGGRRHGSSGTDLEVAVPEGTIVQDDDGAVLADLAHHGDRWRAARGGRGGRGNASFKSNRRRAPGFAEQGERGEEVWYRLELRLMADVALVGFPNAGKSTLISRISAARPKVADYPFTTLEPHLGVVRTDETEMVVADVPGLIEGASEGKGLGHRFLRHVERARVLVVLCDLAPFAEHEPEEQRRVLLDELRRYRPELAERPTILVRSRADLAAPDAAEVPDRLSVSAVTGEGLDELVRTMEAAVREAREQAAVRVAEGISHVVHRPEPEGVRIERSDDGGYRVVGRPAERAVALSDLSDPGALEYARGRLRRLGVDRELARAGARSGDIVHIGDLEFEYEPDA